MFAPDLGASVPRPAGGFGIGVQPASNIPGVQSTAISGNQAALPQIQQLASGINQFNQGQQLQQYQQYNPNIVPSYNQAGTNAMSMLRGEVPDDVLYQIGQGAAERGVAGGSYAGPSNMTDYLRALGLTSLDMTQRGQQNLLSLTGGTPTTPLYDPSRMFLTPEQLLQEQTSYNLAALRGGGGGSGGGGGARSYAPRGNANYITGGPSAGGGAGSGADLIDDILNRYGGGGWAEAPAPRYNASGPFTPQGGYQLPENYGDLGPTMGGVYTNMLDAASQIDPSFYE